MLNITMNMQGMYEEFQREISTLYSREDLVNKIKEVKKQEHTSAFASRWRELEEICDAYGLPVKTVYYDKEHRVELIRTVPTKKKIRRLLLKKLHEMYKKYPMTSDFMERLVRRLAVEFSDDSVRLAILKQFVKYTDYRVGSLENGMKVSFTEEELEEYESLNKEAQREFLLERLTDEMFDEILTDTDKLTVKESAAVMLKKLEDAGACLEKTSEDFLEEAAAGLQGQNPEGEQRLKSIEKELKTVLEKIPYLKKNGKMGTEYERYAQAKKDKLGAKRDKAELFCLAEELASGMFYNNRRGKTRENLYIFALAFGMTAYIDENKDIYYEETDFEKNLLFDYYNDNLLRYVLYKEKHLRPSDFEMEPVGEGINYKNYVEVIYLYYINRRDLDLTPAQRIKKAQRLIHACEKKAKEMEESQNQTVPVMTMVYKEQCIENILAMDKESDIVKYICENYHVTPSEEEKSLSKVLIASEQYTAKEVHKELLWKMAEMEDVLDDEFWDDDDAALSLTRTIQYSSSDFEKLGTYDYGMDISNLITECEAWKVNHKELDAEDRRLLALVEQLDEEFKYLVNKLGEKLRARQKGLFSINRETGYSDKKYFTRAEIIAICMLSFQQELENKALYSVPELYRAFCKETNPYLEACRFQKISEKSIYDMFVFFSILLSMIY